MKTLKKTAKKRVPKELVYEVINGKAVYYRDYDKVLSGNKTIEEVMGSSLLQSLIVSYIIRELFNNIDTSKYFILSAEVGFKYSKNSWYSLDIAIVSRDKVNQITNKFLQTAPEVVIEIDTKADTTKFGSLENYIIKKTQHLLNLGVKKVIWILTRDRKVLLAQPESDWTIKNWDRDIPVIDDFKLNLNNLLQSLE